MKGYLGAAFGLAWGALTVALAVFVVLILLGWRGVDY